MNYFIRLSVAIYSSILFCNIVFAQEFFDDFESYTAGQQLACQNPADWTTWNNLPCDPTEDPYISTDYSYSGIKSVLIINYNDLVKLLGNKTSGYWIIEFRIYIPESGYFDVLSGFTPNPFEWGMECYFDFGGNGRVYGGSETPVYFNWQVGSWQFVQIIISLDADLAVFELNAMPLHSWTWTDGAHGQGSNLNIAAINFFSGFGLDYMYVDNFRFNCEPCYSPHTPGNLTSQIIYNPGPQVQLDWLDYSWNELGFKLIRKSGYLIDSTNFEIIGNVNANVTQYIDSSVYRDSTYTYGVYAYNQYGLSDTSNFVTVTIDSVTSVNREELPITFSLLQNYPNPFNPSTKIKFTISELLFTTLKVYDVLGREITTLVNEKLLPGEYEVNFNSSSINYIPSSGIYFYQLKAGSFIQTKKMILLR